MRGGSRRPRIGPTAVCALLVTLFLAPAAMAAPTTTCAFDGTTGVVSVAVGDGLVATIARAADAIAVDGVPCGGAIVTNTDLIDVTLPAASLAETVAVDLSGGSFTPGATPEASGEAEIEIDIAGVDDDLDTLRIAGGSGPDAIITTGNAVNLNAGEDVADDDVVMDLPTTLRIDGEDGDDFLVLPELYFGGSFVDADMTGGAGDDRIVGGLGASDLDGGPGRDTGDYSWVSGDMRLIWEGPGDAFAWNTNGEDDLLDVERVRLTADHDTVVYVGSAPGESLLRGGQDGVFVEDPAPAGVPEDRIVRGGPGTFDSIEFGASASQPVTVGLTSRRIGGSWLGAYTGIELIFGGDGNDRFLASRRGSYPTVIGEAGNDVVDVRAAFEGMSVTMGQPTFGTRTWLRAFEVERALGSAFDDVVLGPSGLEVSDPKVLIGSGGRDLLVGAAGEDRLVGGAGRDTLRGNGGADRLRGSAGNDRLEGGSGPDWLWGGPGNDALLGGLGVDVCDGGPGFDSFSSC